MPHSAVSDAQMEALTNLADKHVEDRELVALCQALQRYVQAIEERQGQMVGCPEEVAYRLHYIAPADLERLSHAMKGSPYGQYLLRLLEDAV